MALPPSLRRAATALALAIALAAPGAARAQGEPYKQHMQNGVKLYADRNFPAARVEFRAAYEARPNPDPLVNIALCDKGMFRYPQAIAALEEALAKHGGAMDAADKKDAEDAIKEMRTLLGTVTVTLKPPGATLLVDGEELPATLAGKPIPLGPGAHKIAALADGYGSTEKSVSVSSGRDQPLSIDLPAEKGRVTIVAPEPRLTITIDDLPVGNGTWSGMVAPGPHVVRWYGPEGQPYAVQILVAAGVPQELRQGMGGFPLPKKEEPAQRGIYLLGLGSMLFSVTHPPAWPQVKPDFGAGYGLRLGFQVNKTAGFDATYEHSSISTLTNVDAAANYRIVANRLAVGLRLISSGRTVRFVGNFGGGFVVDTITFSPAPENDAKLKCTAPCPLGSGNGVDAFALVEAGLEVDIDRVLLDFSFEGEFQSTGNLTYAPAGPSGPLSIFGSKPLVNAGPAIRVGYRFW